MEYFTWCEDMQMEPVLAVWAGLGLEYGGQPILVGAELDPYVDDTLKELEVLHELLGEASFMLTGPTVHSRWYLHTWWSFASLSRPPRALQASICRNR